VVFSPTAVTPDRDDDGGGGDSGGDMVLGEDRGFGAASLTTLPSSLSSPIVLLQLASVPPPPPPPPPPASISSLEPATSSTMVSLSSPPPQQMPPSATPSSEVDGIRTVAVCRDRRPRRFYLFDSVFRSTLGALCDYLDLGVAVIIYCPPALREMLGDRCRLLEVCLQIFLVTRIPAQLLGRVRRLRHDLLEVVADSDHWCGVAVARHRALLDGLASEAALREAGALDPVAATGSGDRQRQTIFEREARATERRLATLATQILLRGGGLVSAVVPAIAATGGEMKDAPSPSAPSPPSHPPSSSSSSSRPSSSSRSTKSRRR
jgi:hypothetical protein